MGTRRSPRKNRAVNGRSPQHTQNGHVDVGPPPVQQPYLQPQPHPPLQYAYPGPVVYPQTFSYQSFHYALLPFVAYSPAGWYPGPTLPTPQHSGVPPPVSYSVPWTTTAPVGGTPVAIPLSEHNSTSGRVVVKAEQGVSPRPSKSCRTCTNARLECDGQQPKCGPCKERGRKYTCNYSWKKARAGQKRGRPSVSLTGSVNDAADANLESEATIAGQDRDEEDSEGRPIEIEDSMTAEDVDTDVDERAHAASVGDDSSYAPLRFSPELGVDDAIWEVDAGSPRQARSDAGHLERNSDDELEVVREACHKLPASHGTPSQLIPRGSQTASSSTSTQFFKSPTPRRSDRVKKPRIPWSPGGMAEPPRFVSRVPSCTPSADPIGQWLDMKGKGRQCD